MAALALVDYVYGPLGRDLSPVDHAILLAEKLDDASELEGKVGDLEVEIANLNEEKDPERIATLEKCLRELIAAIDTTKIGKVARVGSLVVIEPHANTLEVSLGEALKAAREAL